MARCGLIHGCADHNLIAQISAATGEARVQLGHRFTDGVVSCLKAGGMSCKKSGADRIDFGTISGCHIVYDVIENLKGTKGSEARVSCHKILTGNCGTGTTGESGEGFAEDEQTSYNPTGGGIIPPEIMEYLPYVSIALAILALILVAKK